MFDLKINRYALDFKLICCAKKCNFLYKSGGFLIKDILKLKCPHNEVLFQG